MEKVIELGTSRYNGDWLRKVTEEEAVERLKDHKESQVRNAWKQANGLTIRNHKKKPEIEVGDKDQTTEVED